MANISDVQVEIKAVNCAKEVKTWLKAVDEGAVYTICDDHEGEERKDLGENSAVFNGIASGRWTYENNLEGAFGTKEERENWCSSNEVQIAYNTLLSALEDNHEAYIELYYKECELGWNFISEGEVFMQYYKETGQVDISKSHKYLDEPSVKSLVYYGFASDEQDAKEYLGIEE